MRFRAYGASAVGVLTCLAAVAISTGEARADCRGTKASHTDGADVAVTCHDEGNGGGDGAVTPIASSGNAVDPDQAAWEQWGCSLYGDWHPGEKVNVQPGPAFTDDDYATQGIDPNGQKYSWFHRSCGDYQMGSTSGLTFAPVTGVPGAPPQIVDPRAMAETAASHVRLPELVPAVGSGNPATPSIVHIPVWLWLRSGATEPTPESEPAPGMVVTVHASVSGPVVWDMGDGHRETCTGPGTPWSPSQRDVHATNCSHSYDVDSSGQPGGSYAGTVSVTWTYRWSINGNDQGQLGGPVTRTAAFSVRVDEIQVVNV